MLQRTATSIHVALPPNDVARALERPELLAALDERLSDATVEQHEDTLTVHTPRGPRWDLRLMPEGDGCRVVIGEEEGASRSGLKDLFRPHAQVDRLEADAARLRSLLEAMHLFQPGE